MADKINVLIPEETVDAKIKEIGEQISKDYGFMFFCKNRGQVVPDHFRLPEGLQEIGVRAFCGAFADLVKPRWSQSLYLRLRFDADNLVVL